MTPTRGTDAQHPPPSAATWTDRHSLAVVIWGVVAGVVVGLLSRRGIKPVGLFAAALCLGLSAIHAHAGGRWRPGSRWRALGLILVQTAVGTVVGTGTLLLLRRLGLP